MRNINFQHISAALCPFLTKAEGFQLYV